MKRLAVVVAFGLVLAASLAASASAAAPDYIIVSGPGLSRPVLLDRWRENHALLLSLAGGRPASPAVVRALPARPRLDLVLFWRWRDHPRPVRAAQANQHGWFYPAVRGQAAVVDLGAERPRVAPRRFLRFLRILEGHGVPTRLDPRSG